MATNTNYFPTSFQEYIHLSRYSRWLPDKNRRETWAETVDRYFNFFEQHLKENHKHDITPYRKEIQDAVMNLEVMPSMRCLMTAGEALRRENSAGFNCSFIAIDNPKAFDEILYVLMNGVGAGFSVESKFTEQLPVVAESFHDSETVIVVADSKLGWAKALRELIHLLYSGQVPQWDVSKVRPAGAPLKTFGGRASGPGPLVELFKFCIATFKKAAGRRLTTLECHDIVAKTAEIVVVGGVRRSALISLSDLSDDRLRHAKSGQWWIENVQRALANNSATYKEKPDIGIFMDEWKALYDSKSGERGIFNRESAKKNMEKYGRRDSGYDFGVNPCVVGSTKVRTNAGVMTMQELAEMSNATELLVESYNIHTKKVETQPIMFAGLTKENANVIELEIEDTLGTIHKITLTPDHQVYTENRGYVKAEDLDDKDNLVILATSQTIKGRVVRKNVKENEDVYDLKVLNNHNFFANDILIHNCGEILLRSNQYCNLSEAVIRATDSEEDIARKIRIAAILGTWQSTLTNYKYLSKKWRENCEEERLLGVSLTGIMDSTLTNGKKQGLEERLNKWRELAVETNKEWAEKIGISQSKAVTTGKPSGTVSSLVDSASGIHARHSPYYIRTVRADKKDPLAKLMVDMGFPVEDDVTKPEHNYVFSFPVKAPDNAVFRKDMSAIEQLELWLKYKQNWTEHNQSVTITVREEEWMEVGAWVYKHFDDMTGVSFLPFSDFVYKQAPFQDCSKEEYEALLAKMPKNVDWSKLSDYEKSDHTEGVQSLSCTAGGCELL